MDRPRRIAFLSEHASPLALLGGADAGGQNVYVDEVSPALLTPHPPVSPLPRQGEGRLSGFARSALRPLVGIHAGAHTPARRWPAARFAVAADHLAHHWDAQIVLTGGTGEEEVAQAVAERMMTPALCVAGRTSLGGLAALIERLDLFIANDTGPAHLADALGTPSVTIFGPVDHRRWAPLDQTRHPIVRQSVPCSPCQHAACPIDHRCLRWIEPEAVIEVAERLLVMGVTACRAPRGCWTGAEAPVQQCTGGAQCGA